MLSGLCRILLCEDHAALRNLFARLTDASPEGEQITDLQLPNGNGLGAIKAVRRSQSGAEAMVISGLASIARVLLRRLVHKVPSTPIQNRPDLTPTKMDRLAGFAKSFGYRALAAQLQLSKAAVPVHIRNIYLKSKLNNRSDALYEASRQGLLTL